MKKLLITSTDMMMIQFLVPHVEYLSCHGFHVEIACSEVGSRMADVRNALGHTAKAIHTLRLERSPVSPKNILGYRDLRSLLRDNQYDIIWTNEPVMGALTRLAARNARRSGTRVVYMCHGFHFFKGSSKLSWLLFYPIERFLSRFCDCIATINREDEARAKTFHAPHVAYIHGIGIDTSRLHPQNTQLDIRRELNLPRDAFLVLSVGELNANKNHKTLLHAMARLKDDPQIHYCICGKGDQLDSLMSLALCLGISDRVHFLGYRTDVVDICAQADVFAHASYREGLGLALLEAMYCGLPLVASKIRGIVDYAHNGLSGYLVDPNDADGFAASIRSIRKSTIFQQKCGNYNESTVTPYIIENVRIDVLHLINSLSD